MLTLSRVALVPFIIGAVLLNHLEIAWFLFTVAALTDLLDGIVARYLKEETELGAYLDPVADKLLMLGSYVALAFSTQVPFHIPWWFVILLFLKELVLILGTSYMCLLKRIVSIKPVFLGKLSMGVQVVFVWLLFSSVWTEDLTVSFFNPLVIVIVILSLAALIQYAVIAYKGLRHE